MSGILFVFLTGLLLLFISFETIFSEDEGISLEGKDVKNSHQGLDDRDYCPPAPGPIPRKSVILETEDTGDVIEVECEVVEN
ncbi:hypothetical protein ACFL35_02910 [Candidatus Riflebacteria bacterium]